MQRNLPKSLQFFVKRQKFNEMNQKWKSSIALIAIALVTTIAFAETNTVGSSQPVSTNLFIQPTNLTQLLALPPEQLDKVDIARMDLLCANGLHGSENLDVQQYLDTLDAWAQHVDSETKRNQHLFDEHPERFKNSLAYFRMAMLATVLVQDLQIQYNPEREKQLENGHTLPTEKDENEFFADSKDVFINGLLDGKHYGTCASMPFLYVAIGRRLGYPVTLATTESHFYVRYEEGNGKHFNVEATENRAFLTPSDDEYKNPWELHLTDDEVKGMVYLQPMSNKEILGQLLLTRSVVLRSMGQYDKQAETWVTAERYLPDTPMWKETIHGMQLLAKDEGAQARRDALWSQVAQIYVPHGAGYAYFQDKKVRLHLLMNYSTDTAAIQKAIENFQNELRDYVKPLVEPGDSRIIQLNLEPQQQLVLRYATAAGQEVKIPADFLPPFKNRMIPPELSQRVATKGLDDEESILAEFWTFYDETMQAGHKASQKAIERQAIQNGIGPVLVAREQVPREYWDSIPNALQMRLAGLKDQQKIVDEMWAFQREEAARQQEEQGREKMLAREQAMNLMRQRGISPPQNYGQSAPTASQADAGKQNEIPEMYREWIAPDVASRLTPSDIWLLQQNERNLQAAQQGAKWRQQTEANQPQRASVQLVPASVLNGDATMQNLPLTPRPQSLINASISNGKGQP